MSATEKWHLYFRSITKEKPTLKEDQVTTFTPAGKDYDMVVTLSNDMTLPVSLKLNEKTGSHHGAAGGYHFRVHFLIRNGVPGVMGHASKEGVDHERDLFVGLKVKRGNATPHPADHEAPLEVLPLKKDHEHRIGKLHYKWASAKKIEIKEPDFTRTYSLKDPKSHKKGWEIDAHPNVKEESLHGWFIPMKEGGKDLIFVGYHSRLPKQPTITIPPGHEECTDILVSYLCL